MPFAQPRIVRSPDDCFFYHAMDLPNWGTLKYDSHWDLRGRFEDYIGHVDLRGKRFLEIGAASGFISLEAERRGAEVVSFDMERAEQRQFFPDDRLLGSTQQVNDGVRQELERLKNAYWFSHAAFGSRARAFYGDIYNIPDEIGVFDIVFFGQVLVHLRDPLVALHQGARRCRETLVITEGMFWDWWPRMRFLTGSRDSWWLLSTKLYRHWLATLGFSIKRLTWKTYYFHGPDGRRPFRLGTIVARRTKVS